MIGNMKFAVPDPQKMNWIEIDNTLSKKKKGSNHISFYNFPIGE